MSNTTDDQEVVIILAPARPGIIVAPGSVITEAACGHRAWASPQAVTALRENPGAIARCMGCVDLKAVFSGEVGEVPGAIAAAAAKLGIPEAQLRQDFRRAVQQNGGTVHAP